VSDAYRSAGVDLEAASRATGLIRDIAARASRPEVSEGVGGFAGLYRLGDGRLLAAAADGVGTKLEIARSARRLSTIGIDLVAMCADDVACVGAEPIFFLDYLAVGRLVPEEVASIVEGVAEGCRRAGCALLGGETAEHPGVLEGDRFDLAGVCVGIANATQVLGPHRVAEGDLLIGLASTGLHANGFSLVRSVLLDSGEYGLTSMPEQIGRWMVDELLEPTAIYAPLLHGMARSELISAAAHVTGGGLPENVPRALPDGLGAELDPASWPRPAIFDLIEGSGVSAAEMFSVFNMGIGMVLVVPVRAKDEVLTRAKEAGAEAYVIGKVVAGSGLRLLGLEPPGPVEPEVAQPASIDLPLELDEQPSDDG